MTQTQRSLRIPNHAAADERHLAIELRREIHEDLHPVEARRERSDEQLAAHAREDLLERLDHLELRSGEAAPIDVRAVGEQREDSLRAELRKAVHVEVLAVDRRLIDLEVAGVQDHSCRGADGQRHAVGHAVRDADEFDLERADGDAVARTNGDERMALLDAVLL